MKYLLSESEALYLKNRFGFSKLLGLNENQRVKAGTEELLKKRNIIYDYNGHDELQTIYRVLFSNWQKMRYTIVRPEINNDEQMQCVLSNEDMSMFLSRINENITIDIFDFDENKMDALIRVFTQLPDIKNVENRFNLTMSVEEYTDFIACENEAALGTWQKMTGIRADILMKCLNGIKSGDGEALLLVEDHIGDIGYMAKFSCDGNTVYALKHVTRGSDQKVVLLMGDTQYIVDSVYNF